MGLNIYLILLVVLLIFNLVFWVIVIWFRIFYDCDGSRSRPNANVRSRQSSDGQTNPGFTDQDDPATALPRPFTIPETMECPPSYEEALKYDQFGFRILYPQDILIQRPNLRNSREVLTLPTPYQVLSEAVPGTSSADEPRHVATSNYTPSSSFGDGSSNGIISYGPDPCPMTSGAISCISASISSTNTTSHNSTSSISSETTPHSSANSSSSGIILHSSASSHNLTSQLSTIAEEDDSTVPVTLVIDCIGVQTARLIENCDTTVNLTNGKDLDTHSKC